MALLSRVLHHSADKDRPSVSRSNSSYSNGLTPTTSGSSTHSVTPATTYSLSINLESPPIILYGQPHESTGSIISGILTLDINTEYGSSRLELNMEAITLSLVQTIRYSKTFAIPSSSVTGCKDCNTKATTLARWDVLASPKLFSSGSYAYPFSHLLPGSLPPTSKLGSFHSNCYIKYELIAVGISPNSSKEVSVKMPVNIVRLILRGPDRNSLRVFPPTDVTAGAVLPNVVYPKSNFPVELKLDNIVSKSGDRRWRMRKLSWRIEENSKVRAYTCPKHASKLRSVEQTQKKIAMQKDSSNSQPAKTSNMHHSTIQSSMSYLTNPSGHSNSHTIPDIPGNEDAEAIEPELEAPRDAHQSFLEDFAPTATQAQAADASGATEQTTPNNVQESHGHVYLEETRTVTHGEIKSGWKSDFSERGRVELVAEISAANFATGYHPHISKRSSDIPNNDEKHLENLRNVANVACDIEDPTLGIFVNHTLIVEVVVAEEVVQSGDKKKKDHNLTPVSSSRTNSPYIAPSSPAPAPNPQIGVPTGAARVLRMQFKLHVTERSGLGIAWDDEVPPTYEDVRTLSPPTYETSQKGTPVSTPLFPAPSATYRGTPGVLYGVGDTPGTGLFGLRGDSALSIDQMVDLDERIQDLTI
ncbi:uncharacterized protein CANTADRAFT_36022 [Suhomyces tanzawaensis NRRL Y-17324]